MNLVFSNILFKKKNTVHPRLTGQREYFKYFDIITIYRLTVPQDLEILPKMDGSTVAPVSPTYGYKFRSISKCVLRTLLQTLSNSAFCP